jgi:hypothetical protein
MGDAAKDETTVELPCDAFARMLGLMERQTRALELIVETEQRRLAQVEDTARRAARKIGPTTPEIEARVRERMERWK